MREKNLDKVSWILIILGSLNYVPVNILRKVGMEQFGSFSFKLLLSLQFYLNPYIFSMFVLAFLGSLAWTIPFRGNPPTLIVAAILVTLAPVMCLNAFMNVYLLQEQWSRLAIYGVILISVGFIIAGTGLYILTKGLI